jgi:hypothetical protein
LHVYCCSEFTSLTVSKNNNKITGYINTSNYYPKCEASLAKRFLHTAYKFKFNQVTLYNLSFPPAPYWCLDRVLKSNTHTNKIVFTLLSLYRNKNGEQVTPKAQKKNALLRNGRAATEGALAAPASPHAMCQLLEMWGIDRIHIYHVYIPPARPHTSPVRFSYYTLFTFCKRVCWTQSMSLFFMTHRQAR